MTELIHAEVNCETGEVIERPFTEEEKAQHAIDAANAAAERAEIEAAQEALATLKASVKAKLITGTPLTEEEASVLVI